MQLQITTALKGQSSGNYIFLSYTKPCHFLTVPFAQLCRDFRYQLSAGQYITAWEAGSKKGTAQRDFLIFFLLLMHPKGTVYNFPLIKLKHSFVGPCLDFTYQLLASHYITAWEASSKRDTPTGFSHTFLL
jgi:hypothetical protein